MRSRKEVEQEAEILAMKIHSAKKTAPLVRAFVHGYLSAWEKAVEEYADLLEDSKKLQALEAGGVDNWEWYDLSLEEYYQEQT